MKRCVRCVMTDESDPFIRFDENGVCNYCTDALKLKTTTYFPDERGGYRLEALIRKLKCEGKEKSYDCVMGLSGGLDSSYLAYLGAVKWGLRIAAVHVDDGYDTEISQNNIRRLCEAASLNLISIRPDPEQYNALTKAYMQAGVPNLAVPQDNILIANVCKFAKQNHIRYFLSGGNFALESILQQGNTWDAHDVRNLKAIHKRFGEKPIDKLEFISSYSKQMDRFLRRLETVRPLNYVDYNRNRAFAELKDFCGFEYYGRKHLENYLTAFVQLYWLPKKFSVDKRTSHLSSMIVSGQMTRDEALRELQEPLYEKDFMERVQSRICENMDMSPDELDRLVREPGHQHDEYPVDRFGMRIWRLIKLFRK